MTSKSNKDKAFTLIELLVVIAIIGILSSVVLAALSGARESAKVTRTVSDWKQIETALTMWMQNTRRTEWPEPSEVGDGGNSMSLDNLVENTSLGDYLTSVPDPQFDDVYTYYNNGSNGDCGTSGVIIRNPNMRDTDIAADLNKAVEDDGNMNCGQVRHYSDRRLYYVISETQSF